MPFIIELADPAPPTLIPVSAPVRLDLLSGLPPFEQDSIDIQGVVGVIANELSRVEQARTDLISNFFPASSSALLHIYEQLLGLPPDPPHLSLAERQQIVIAFFLKLKSQGTGLEWEAAMTKLVGNNWTYREHDPADVGSPPAYTVLIRLPYSGAASVPTSLAAVQGAPGTLVAGTYYYALTSTTAFGSTVACAPVAVTIAASKSVNLTWAPLGTPVSGFNVYRGFSPTSLKLIGSATVNAFTDDGSGTPGLAPPTVDSSYSIQTAAALKLARQITPAHLALTAGYSAGFIIGVSLIGIDVL